MPDEFGQKLDMMRTISDERYTEEKPKKGPGYYIKLFLIIIFSIAAIVVWLFFFKLI